MPALHPLGPGRVGPVDAGRVVVAGAHRRVAAPERGDRTLQRVEHLAVMPAGRRVRVQPLERVGVQVFQPRAAVDQQGLAEHPPQPVLPGQDAAVTPLLQHRPGPAQRVLDRLGAEHEPGQVQAVERAELLEGVEAAEQVAERDQEGRTVVSVGSGCAATNASALAPHTCAQSALVHAQ